jgi:hypothetical protein
VAVQNIAESFKGSGDNLAKRIQGLCQDFSARGVDASMAQDSGSVMVMVETPGKNPLLITIKPNPGRFDLSFWRDLSDGKQSAQYDGVQTIRGDVDAVVESVGRLIRDNTPKAAARRNLSMAAKF